ncbi:MAG: hypothetical protein O3C68_03035, partial [Proteobacteria bacterium]|nr:hypothetical protein [Pseudomonadota bacterium]
MSNIRNVLICMKFNVVAWNMHSCSIGELFKPKKEDQMKQFLSSACLMLALAITGTAYGGVIFDNGSSTANLGGSCSGCSGEWTVFDDSTFSTSQTVGGIIFDAAFYQSALVGGFDVTATFWTSVQGTVLNSQTFDLYGSLASYLNNTGNGGSNADNFTVTLDIVDFTLGAGTYWLSLFGVNPDVGGSYNYMAFSGLSGNVVQCPNTGGCSNRDNAMA